MTPDQQALVGLAAEILGSTVSDEVLWRQLAEAGLLGIAVPEALGGAGLGLDEVLLLLEQQGRFLARVPLWDQLLGGLALAQGASPQQQAHWLPGLASGTTRLSLAVSLDGTSGVLVAGPSEVVLGVDDEGAFLAPTPEGTAIETTNHTLAYDLDLSAVAKERLALDPQWLLDAARLGLAAQQLGVVDAGVREAAKHLSGREQFGRPLATFQATTQQLGDAYCDVQAMRATLCQAAWALQQGAARREVDVATWWATDAGERAQHVVQHLHGGLGADITYQVHGRLLWTMRINALLGGPSRQLVRLGAAVVAP